VKRVARDERNREHHERDYADYVGGQEVMEGKKESSQARQNSKHQEYCVPGIKSFPSKQSVNDDESRSDPHQAQHNMEESKGRQRHAQDHGSLLSEPGC
jgi:hypothetical protein